MIAASRRLDAGRPMATEDWRSTVGRPARHEDQRLAASRFPMGELHPLVDRPCSMASNACAGVEQRLSINRFTWLRQEYPVAKSGEAN